MATQTQIQNSGPTQDQISKAEQVQSMSQIILSQFLAHKAAVVGSCVILFFMIIALTAPLISMVTGISPESQNPLNRFAPIMTRVELPSDQKEDALYKFENAYPDQQEALRSEIISLGLTSSTRPEDATYDLFNLPVAEAKEKVQKLSHPLKSELANIVSKFETLHLLGTDELGRDVFIRLVYGTRVSLFIGILVAIVSACIGLIIGSLAGYYGGAIDSALMRVTDALLSLPIIPFLIVLAAIDLNKIPAFNALVGSRNESIVKMIAILLLFSWMTTARLVRGSILSLREREFILAAKTLGAKDSTIIFRHMIPNVIAPMLVSVTLGVGSSIIFESALSFLGLGVQQPTPTWGNMLSNAQDLISEAPWLAILPGLLILATTMSFNYIGDGLQDAVDPKAIRR